MEVKIRLRTPAGQANKVRKRFGPFLLGSVKAKETLVNKEDSEIIWVIEGSSRRINKVMRNVNYYGTLVGTLLKNKHIKKMCDKKDLPVLEDMLKNQTSVEVIKEATLQEIQEDNKTFWQKIKEKFKKID